MTLRCSCALRSDSLRVRGRGEPFDLNGHEALDTPADRYPGLRMWDAVNSRHLLRVAEGVNGVITEPPASWTVAALGWSPGAAVFHYRKTRGLWRCSFAACIVFAADTTFAGTVVLQLPHAASTVQQQWAGTGWIYKDETGAMLPLNVVIDTEQTTTSFTVEYGNGNLPITTTNPFTHNANDEMAFSLTYGMSLL
jgi:hypothetical protein